MTPQIVTASPAWKLFTVLQISAVALRSSTKKVSVPLPPVRKFEPVPPSKTFVPLLTARASLPFPAMDEPVGRADADIKIVGSHIDKLFLNIAHRTRILLRGLWLPVG